ncbi:MAG TPA: Gfo/Idh/MocA family oxidoreductase [Anaerolineales bacterium]|nr:Gfo/Idh/MocA family oxidoreductase [Anaerolineales bacterium]
MKHRVGIIGLGMIGERMLAEFMGHPSFEVAACWDLSEKVCAGVRAAHPAVPIVDGPEAVLNADGIDMIYIATPPITHVEYGLKVAELGLPLLMEKPLSTRLEDSRKFVDAVEKTGIRTAMNFGYAAGPIVDKVQEMIDSSGIGEIRSMEVRYQYPSWPLPNQLSASPWITNRRTGGMVREMFSHIVYLVHRVLGKLEVVSATVSYPPGEDTAEDFVLAHLRCGDIPLWFMGGVSSPHTPRTSDWTINGSAGALRLGESAGILSASGGAWEDFPAGSDKSAVEARLDELAAMIEGRPHRLPSLRDGLEVQEVIEELLETGGTG